MSSSQIFTHWHQVRADLLTLIDQFSDEELAYVPFAGSWSVGQIILHIAEAEEGWIRYAILRQLEKWPEPHQPQEYPTTAALKSALTKVHEQTEQYLDSLDETHLIQWIDLPWDECQPLLDIIWHVVEHEIHHRGELSLILGLLGHTGLDL